MGVYISYRLLLVRMRWELFRSPAQEWHSILSKQNLLLLYMSYQSIDNNEYEGYIRWIKRPKYY